MRHNLNSVTLEVNAATDLVDREIFATVFAIHNRYAGTDEKHQPKEKAVPISILFGKNTLALARKTIRKGTHFAVVGALDYDRADVGPKEFFTIRADCLSIYSKPAVTDGNGATTSQPKAQRSSRSVATRT